MSNEQRVASKLIAGYSLLIAAVQFDGTPLILGLAAQVLKEWMG